MSLNIERRRERSRPTSKRGADLQAIIDEIEELVGLDPVKSEIYRIIDFARIIALKKERDLPVSNASFHMIFTGPPGTGKTTIARYVGRIFYEINLLRKGHLVETDREGMVGQHLGDTAKIVKDKVKDALDGVLFVDEAYTLSGGGGPTGKTDPFGQEAMDTLLKEMEDKRDRLVCVFAGYTSEMRRFLDVNPGLRSRVSRTIEFPSYSGDELFDIFKMMTEKNKMIVTDEAFHEVKKHIDDIARSADENFGNAREVRQLFETLQTVQAERLAYDHPNLEDLTNDDLMTINGDDIAYYLDHI
ncbi:MAG: AAA family ATPase [Sphingomonadales bacterium]